MLATFIRRDLDKPQHHEIIDLDVYKITKPTVFCFSGNGTISTTTANGMCKIAEHQLRLLFDEKTGFNLFDNVDLVGVAYGVRNDGDKIGVIDDESLNKLIDNVLRPLCVDKKGNLLDVDTICKNLSMINFFTFCHGAMEVGNILHCLSKNLFNNLSEKEQFKIFSSITQVSYSPVTRLVPCPSIIVTSAQDSFSISETIEYEDSLGKLDGIDIIYNNSYESMGEVDKYKIFPHIHIYSSRLSIGPNRLKNEHHIRLLDRNNDWGNAIEVKSGEKIDFGPNADAVSQMTSYALCQSVENGLQNMNSKTYIPKRLVKDTFYDLLSIKNSFDEPSLSF